MTPPPARPKLYHITHVDNLAAIVAAAELVCNAAIGVQGGPAAAIGITGIKQFRLPLPVKCHSGDRVGDYVPFYFCPRSIMLFVIHRGNHPGLTYRGGQDPIVHLEADLHDVVAWAGRMAAARPSPCPTRALATPSFARASRPWTRSTGLPSQRESSATRP